MTVWSYPISWSKFKSALTCPKQLLYAIDKAPPSIKQRGWHTGLGTAVQKVFELFYNQGLWKFPHTRTELVLKEISKRVIASGKWDEGIIYDNFFSRQDLEKTIYEQVENGRKILEKEGLLAVEMSSERKWSSTFRNFRMYAQVDFFRGGRDSVEIYDGKGNREKNADPRQLLYYALAIHAGGVSVSRAAFIYWRHGMEEVSVTKEDLKRFADGDYAKAMELFHQLKSGVSSFPATPSKEACEWCPQKLSCTDSRYFKVEYRAEGYVELGGVG